MDIKVKIYVKSRKKIKVNEIGLLIKDYNKKINPIVWLLKCAGIFELIKIKDTVEIFATFKDLSNSTVETLLTIYYKGNNIKVFSNYNRIVLMFNVKFPQDKIRDTTVREIEKTLVKRHIDAVSSILKENNKSELYFRFCNDINSIADYAFNYLYYLNVDVNRYVYKEFSKNNLYNDMIKFYQKI